MLSFRENTKLKEAGFKSTIIERLNKEYSSFQEIWKQEGVSAIFLLNCTDLTWVECLDIVKAMLKDLELWAENADDTLKIVKTSCDYTQRVIDLLEKDGSIIKCNSLITNIDSINTRSGFISQNFSDILIDAIDLYKDRSESYKTYFYFFCKDSKNLSTWDPDLLKFVPNPFRTEAEKLNLDKPTTDVWNNILEEI